MWIATSAPATRRLSITYANAPLTELGRLRLARCVVDEWPDRRAAERFQVSVSTAQRWAARYRERGAAGMADRSSRPRSSPRRTPTRIERRIIKVRLARRWGPARYAYLLGLVPSTVHRVPTRYRLARLSHVVLPYELGTPGVPDFGTSGVRNSRLSPQVSGVLLLGDEEGQSPSSRLLEQVSPFADSARRFQAHIRLLPT